MNADDALIVSALDSELLRRKREEPLRYVKLNKPCEEFARRLLDAETYITVFAAPNGVGKTRTAITAR